MEMAKEDSSLEMASLSESTETNSKKKKNNKPEEALELYKSLKIAEKKKKGVKKKTEDTVTEDIFKNFQREYSDKLTVGEAVGVFETWVETSINEGETVASVSDEVLSSLGIDEGMDK